MKRLFLIHLFTFVFLLPCFAQNGISHIFLDGDNNSGVYERKYYIVRSAAEWGKINERSAVRNKETLLAIENFDFSTHVLFFYFAGDMCNGAEVAALAEDQDKITIQIDHLIYDANCRNSKLLVTPWLLISFKAKPGQKILLTDKVRLVHCN